MTIRAELDEMGVTVYGAPDVDAAIQHMATVGAPDHDWYLLEGETGPRMRRYRLDADCSHEGWHRTIPGCPDWCGEGHKYHHHIAQPHSRGAFRIHFWPWPAARDYIPGPGECTGCGVMQATCDRYQARQLVCCPECKHAEASDAITGGTS